MKTYNNLYDKIHSFENLIEAYNKAKLGKRPKKYVREFEANLEQEIFQLKYELENQTYHPSPLHRFVIHDPKTRVIHAPAFRDRVVHHAICNIIEPIFDKTFIFDSYASRKGKGTHKALIRFDEFKHKVSRNGLLSPHALETNMIRGYVFKADIRHYFPSVDHEVLMNLIKIKISDKKVLRLLRMFIECYSSDLDKGMPLGALTSQLFANVYLNPLDHFVKEKLRLKYYIRYLDDFAILNESKIRLEVIKSDVENFLSNELKLELHPEKSKIFPLHKGITLLGFRIFYHHRLLKKSNLKQFFRRFEIMEEELYEGLIDELDFEARVDGWLAHAKWGNTYKIQNDVKKSVSRILDQGNQFSPNG